MSLIKSCRQELESAEQKVKELIKNSEGGYSLKDQQ